LKLAIKLRSDDNSVNSSSRPDISVFVTTKGFHSNKNYRMSPLKILCKMSRKQFQMLLHVK